ncbi:MAG: hypothetical protein QOD48_56, partial [Gaiellaceae bacterium]|nr:hypothetical protein [Gaiellaceae bacterium]
MSKEAARAAELRELLNHASIAY